jgi:hypothetical protein
MAPAPEKRIIGERFKELTRDSGLRLDIEIGEIDHRI